MVSVRPISLPPESFSYFCQKKRIKERKEGRLSLWNQILHPLQKLQCCQMSTFLWPQGNIWPEDSHHMESCSDAVGYENLDPLKRRDSWGWFSKIIFMEAIWRPRRPSILPDRHNHISPSEGMSLRLLVANRGRSSPGNLWICYSSWQTGAWDGTKNTDLEMKRVFWWSCWDYLITWILESEESSQAEVQRKNGGSRRKLKRRPIPSSPSGEYRGGCGPRNAGGLWQVQRGYQRAGEQEPDSRHKSEQARKQAPSSSLQKGTQPPNNLIWTQWDSHDFWHSGLDYNNLVLV